MKRDFAALVGDARALGRSAPLRAAYEASKRGGLHAVLFAGGSRRAAPRSMPFPLGNLEPLSDEASQRTLDDAASIITQGVRVFGRRVPNGVDASWLLDPQTGMCWPGNAPWWRIDIRSEQRLGDVKFVWEAARHRDLVVLARASRLEPAASWDSHLTRLLQQWLDENQPERGVNWYSSLELALRAITWNQILLLAGDLFPPLLRSTMDMHLLASARHLLVELPYTMSSMKNNHLLGDALGLIVLARMFPTYSGARRWTRLGHRLFLTQLARHMRDDGSMIEDSLSYHRFVLEMLIVRILLGDAGEPVKAAAKLASNHLVRLGVFEGDLPQYGDWDEGRVIASSGSPLDVAGTVALGLSLSGDPIPRDSVSRYDEIAWYSPRDAPHRGHRSIRRHAEESGGIAYAQAGPWRVWLKVGSGPSHGHADLTSVWLEHGGRWIIADPGTGTYNGAIEVRNGLRTSRAHPVLRLDDEHQLRPHRAFRWLDVAAGHISPPQCTAGRTILFGWHDAYGRVIPKAKVARAIVLDQSSVTIIDLVSPEARGHRWAMTIPWAQGVRFSGDTLHLDGREISVAGLQGATSHGQQNPFSGWQSKTYGQLSEAEWLTIYSRESLHVWRIGDGPDFSVEPDDSVRVGDLELRVSWLETGPRLDTVANIASDKTAAPK